MAKKKELSHALEDIKLKARLDWVLVKPIEKQSKKTESGLIRPDNDEDQQKSVGTVLNAGEDAEGIKDGDVVLYGVYAGELIEVTEKGKAVEYRLLKNEDIIAFVR